MPQRQNARGSYHRHTIDQAVVGRHDSQKFRLPPSSTLAETPRAGSLLLGIGFLLLAMAGLRALQEETLPHWSGNWSWVPYLLTMAGAVAVAVLLGLRITSDRRRAGRRRDSAGKGA